MNRLLDNEVAPSAGSQHNGARNREKWTRKVRGYLVSQCPGIAPILDLAEGVDDTPLSLEHIREQANSYRWMTELNIGRLGGRLWGMAQLSPHGQGLRLL